MRCLWRNAASSLTEDYMALPSAIETKRTLHLRSRILTPCSITVASYSGEKFWSW